MVFTVFGVIFTVKDLRAYRYIVYNSCTCIIVLVSNIKLHVIYIVYNLYILYCWTLFSIFCSLPTTEIKILVSIFS